MEEAQAVTILCFPALLPQVAAVQPVVMMPMMGFNLFPVALAAVAVLVNQHQIQREMARLEIHHQHLQAKVTMVVMAMFMIQPPKLPVVAVAQVPKVIRATLALTKLEMVEVVLLHLILLLTLVAVVAVPIMQLRVMVVLAAAALVEITHRAQMQLPTQAAVAVAAVVVSLLVMAAQGLLSSVT
jgi:hypothetical protein